MRFMMFVKHAENPQACRFGEPAVTTGGRLVGDLGHLGDRAERRPRLNRQDMDNLPIDGIEHVNFHEISLDNVEIQHNQPLRWMNARHLAHHDGRDRAVPERHWPDGGKSHG